MNSAETSLLKRSLQQARRVTFVNINNDASPAIAAPGAGKRIVITAVCGVNTHSTQVRFWQLTGASLGNLFYMQIPVGTATEGGNRFAQFAFPIALGENEALNATVGAGAGNLVIYYFVEDTDGAS